MKNRLVTKPSDAICPLVSSHASKPYTFDQFEYDFLRHNFVNFAKDTIGYSQSTPCYIFYDIVCKYLHLIRRYYYEIQYGRRSPSWICWGSRRTTHERRILVAIPCKNFVAISLNISTITTTTTIIIINAILSEKIDI